MAKASKLKDGKICWNCKYFAQGPNNCYCANPEQKDEDLKKYTYWPFSCELFTKGRHESIKKN